MKELNTDRLLLRAFRRTDVRDLYAYASNPHVGPRAGWAPHTGLEMSRDVLRSFIERGEVWAIVLKETDELIGCMGYYTHEESNIGIGEMDAELGYWIGKPYWNRGLCTEALRAMVDHCFNTVGYETLWSDYFVDNPASGRVMEKCGFRDTGEVNWLSHLYSGDERPVKVMRLDYAL